MAAAQRAAATNGPDPDPGPDPGTGAGFCQSIASILDDHVSDNNVWRLCIVVVVVVVVDVEVAPSLYLSMPTHLDGFVLWARVSFPGLHET